MKMLSQNDFFYTSEMPLVATLQIYGFNIEIIERIGSGKAIFHFKRNRELDDLIQEFWAQKVKVEPITYFNSLKLVKSRLYERE